MVLPFLPTLSVPRWSEMPVFAVVQLLATSSYFTSKVPVMFGSLSAITGPARTQSTTATTGRRMAIGRLGRASDSSPRCRQTYDGLRLDLRGLGRIPVQVQGLDRLHVLVLAGHDGDLVRPRPQRDIRREIHLLFGLAPAV